MGKKNKNARDKTKAMQSAVAEGQSEKEENVLLSYIVFMGILVVGAAIASGVLWFQFYEKERLALENSNSTLRTIYKTKVLLQRKQEDRARDTGVKDFDPNKGTGGIVDRVAASLSLPKAHSIKPMNEKRQSTKGYTEFPIRAEWRDTSALSREQVVRLIHKIQQKHPFLYPTQVKLSRPKKQATPEDRWNVLLMIAYRTKYARKTTRSK